MIVIFVIVVFIIIIMLTPSQMQRNQGWFDEHESSKVSPDFITDPVAVEEVTWSYDNVIIVELSYFDQTMN